MQWHGYNAFGMVFTLLLVTCILFNVSRARGKDLFVRRIAGLNAMDEAIGRATEMGRPILMVPGIGNLNAISVQALNIFAYVTKLAARFATPIRLCCGNAAVYTVAQEVIRDVYQSEGLIEAFDQDSVQFITDRQFAFAAGVSGMILREKCAASFLLGEFFAEALIFAETGNSVGAIQVAGSTQNTQTPFFIAACDYVLIADEFYAANAYLSRETVLVGSLIGQDWCKFVIMALVVFVTLFDSLEMASTRQTTEEKDGQVTTIAPRLKSQSELWSNNLFNPKPPPPMEAPREKRPEPTSQDGGNR